jgi:NTP pyrophosphatase (non-canonical NTP hydrolase)
MTLQEYQDVAVETAIYGAGNVIIYPSLGLANEAGEVLGKVKKVLRDKGGDFTSLETRIAIADEMGDVLWYLAALSRDIEIPLESIAQRNIEKLLDRRARNVIQGSGDNR